VLRVIVVDTSLRSLSGTATLENPVEDQLTWLSEVLSGRPAGERAVVVSETPSYTYGPGFGTDTLLDSAAFETLMGQDRVSAVISGRLGWNGLYYTSAPGLHCPQADGSYPDPSTACSPTAPAGTGSAEQQVLDSAGSGLATLAGALGGLGAPEPGPTNDQLGAYPTIIAASAGAPFGPPDQPASGSSADQGYWHGYTRVRLLPSGSVVVEQRPILDWIGIQARSHVLEPGQHMGLDGYGREPVGTDVPAEYDTIISPAITHRYDLVVARPRTPWLPETDSSGADIPMNPAVATIDRETGQIRTGSGSHPRVYALAILSVGTRAATYPITFEPSKTFMPPRPLLPPLPGIAPALPAQPVHVAALAATAPPLPTSPPPVPPEVGTPSLPQLPVLSPPAATNAVSPPTPPAPPAPPPPPGQPTPGSFALNARLSPIGINATVVPPSPPPVNPAPPSGSAARKEAKQRQAATAKSEEGGGQEGVNPQDAQAPTNGVTSRDQAASTRLEQRRPLSFTAIANQNQPSAWARDALYGGGMALAAFAFALGWAMLRPRPCRREPTLPAPSRAWESRQ
jgi:hypothetical protein